jgi:hypothetical protein
MKHFGSSFEYAEERNADIMRAYRQELSRCKQIFLPEVFNNVVNMPSKRFSVSAERAAIVISNMMRGDDLLNMRPTKREMFQEIYRRIKILQEQNPRMSIYEMALKVVQEPAPKFYITAGSAKVIIYRIRKQWHKKRSQELRHLRLPQR